jgi:hypothetical protein
MLNKTINGRVFGLELSDVSDAGALANGERGYTASADFYRDGTRVGGGRWDVEGFEDATDLRGQPLDFGDGEIAIWDALAEMAREHLARRGGPAAGGIALAL